LKFEGPQEIRIRGARVHNLKNVNVVLPRNRLVAITGLSGSGKSSLAFDTLYAEGQRRYVESLSAYARQFLEQMQKPDVDAIDGLSPAISIEQKTVSHNPRSTAGTVTEIYDYLRLLFARAGKPHCPSCGQPITRQTVQEIVDLVLGLPRQSRFSVMAPVLRGRKGEHKKLLEDLRKQGFTRINVDGEVCDLEEDLTLDPNRRHDIEVYVDRLVIKPDVRGRLTDSVEIALTLAEGLVKIAPVDGDDVVYSERHACIDCGISLPEISPRLFSFNGPHGACPACDGLGEIRFVDPALVVPDPDLSLREGAIVAWGKSGHGYMLQMLDTVTRHFKFGMDTPFGKLPESARKVVFHGSGEVELKFNLQRDEMSHEFRRPFEGVITNLERRYRETSSNTMRAEIESYMVLQPCRQCQGRRLRKEALCVLVGGISIADITRLSITDALRFLDELELESRSRPVAERIIKEIHSRLKFMQDVGLNYLSLDRPTATLSGGEGQRIRLATQIGSSLTGVLYVLDEPTVGLHPRDCRRLLDTLGDLRDRGNTVVVVEHDPATILAADHVVDMGPGAGRNGGEVVAEGTPRQILDHPDSLTGAYLSGKKKIPVPFRRRKAKRVLGVLGARGNNLKNIDVEFPLGVFACVTGVSGSGKSTLVIDTLYRGLAQRLHRARQTPAEHGGFRGLKQLDKVVHIDQSPIGRTPRSNPVTYTGIFTGIRELFARLPESRMRGYSPGRYSFNVKGGRCEACEGGGQIRIEMHFLPDMFITCEMCGGQRFNRETLEISYRGKSISQVLQMTVNEAMEFFENQPATRRKLQTIVDVGLGYIQLGQSATTLSGGEAQRVKLARELSKRATGRTLYILDEPTTGLHMDDIRQLVDVLDRLVDEGNTVVVIEHNLDVIKQADVVIDLGPEGGEEGGRVVATGTPEQLARLRKSHTGRYLREVLPGKRASRKGKKKRARA
jgi:excinuclease ABC subunit A